MKKTAARMLFTALALATAMGCDKSGDNAGGAGPTETSERYQGVGETTKQTHERNPATLPTQPAAPTPAAPGDENAPTEEPLLPGTTRTPEGAFPTADAGAAGGATVAPSGNTALKSGKGK